MGDTKEEIYKIEREIEILKSEIKYILLDINEIKLSFSSIVNMITKLNDSINYFKSIIRVQQIPLDNKADRKINPTDNWPFKPLNNHILGISIGNEGVPADRQTNQQTDRHIENSLKIEKIPQQNSLHEAGNILNSLDNLKREIRLKFKKLTEQEISVFSAIYLLEEEYGEVDYKVVSKRLNLTESSIRDYVSKLIQKGIPIEKKRINNKSIQLSISKNLKRITSLSTILQLREL